MLAAELGRVSARYYVWILPITVAAVVPGALRPGVLLWVDSLMGFNAAFVAVNPLIAGLVCWEVGRRSKAQFALRIGSARRGRLAVLGTHLGAIVIWVLVASAVTVVGLSISMASMGAYGEPEWPWLLANVAGLLLSTAIGYVTGFAWRGRWFVAPLLIVLLYVGWGYISRPVGGFYWISRLYPTAVTGSGPFVEYVDSTFFGQIAWYLGVGLILLALLALPAQRGLGVALTLALGAVGVVAGVAAIVPTNGQTTHGYNARDYECDDDQAGLTVCVHAAYAAALPGVLASFEAFDQRAAGTSLVATKLEHQGMGIGDEPSPGARSVYIENLAPGYETEAVRDYVATYGNLYECVAEDNFFTHLIVDTWLVGESAQDGFAPGVTFEAAARFDALDDGTRNRWLRDHESSYLECDLTYSDLP